MVRAVLPREAAPAAPGTCHETVHDRAHLCVRRTGLVGLSAAGCRGFAEQQRQQQQQQQQYRDSTDMPIVIHHAAAAAPAETAETAEIAEIAVAHRPASTGRSLKGSHAASPGQGSWP